MSIIKLSLKLNLKIKPPNISRKLKYLSQFVFTHMKVVKIVKLQQCNFIHKIFCKTVRGCELVHYMKKLSKNIL